MDNGRTYGTGEGKQTAAGRKAEKRPFRAYEGNKPYLFISYSHKDSALVYPIIEKWFLAGYNIWYDQGIPNNAVLDLEISRKIRSCDVFLLFLSEQSLASEYVFGKELPKARRWNKEILFVRLDDKDYSRACQGAAVLGPEEAAEHIPSRCRECEKRDPAPIEVDLSQGVELVRDDLNGFSYSVSDGKVVIEDFVLSDAMKEQIRKEGSLHIVVPDRHQGFPVIGIAEDVTFHNLNNVKGAKRISITLPDCWENMGEEAFACSEEQTRFDRQRQRTVLEVHLPEQLKTVDVECFSNCDTLEHIDLPYGLESIEECAFWQCESLQEVIIPETVKSIGPQAFEDCEKLAFAVIPPQTTDLGDSLFGELGDRDEYYDHLDEEDWDADEDDESDEEDWEADEDDESDEEEDFGSDDRKDREKINLNKVFHVICVEGSAAHRYAEENNHFVKLISEKEMEEIYQAPLRRKHQEAMEKAEQEKRQFVLKGMETEEGPYGCLVVCEEDKPLVEDLLWHLGEDGFRLRFSAGMEGETVDGCATLLPMLSGHNVQDSAYIRAIAGSHKPLFPLMLDNSPVPGPLSKRFIMHLSDRTPEDLLNEIREHLARYGCKGNPRAEEAAESQFVDPFYVYHVDTDYDVEGRPRGVVLDQCKQKESVVRIPDELFGLPVVRLQDGLFKNRTDLIQVTVGTHVRVLSSGVFAGCTALKEITLPPSVEVVYGTAFEGCSQSLVFHVKEGSFAARFAEENGFVVDDGKEKGALPGTKKEEKKPGFLKRLFGRG